MSDRKKLIDAVIFDLMAASEKCKGDALLDGVAAKINQIVANLDATRGMICE